MAAIGRIVFCESNCGRWKAVIEDLASIRKALGEEVLAGFCGCFLWCDRLLSAQSLVVASESHWGKGSTASYRDLHTAVWFAVGCLRELGHATSSCRGAMAKGGCFDGENTHWKRIHDFEEKWNRDRFSAKMRNKGAFHLDADVMLAGINELAKKPSVTLAKGDGPQNIQTTNVLGFLAMVKGLGFNVHDGYRGFLARVHEDLNIADAIIGAFGDAAAAAGITIVNHVRQDTP